ncbi:hypothetical protein BCR34DRAFT_554381 [Clohesyomyces aquaticus]|uniref:DUF6590 domain-containing protein n=1 Tax=Clohesyomyces aquaticus TaxID=1231657 RepID=A0A1Y2A6S0_9PLEO|nr:hypothetical protein BCR34DRAFT_554381 [Clohesyomyces aquaticus]
MSEYTPWIWSPEYQRHYCYRVDPETGETKYLWSEPVAPAESAETYAAPRSTPAQTILPQTGSGSSSGNYTYHHAHPGAATAQPVAPLPEDVQETVGGDKPRRYIKTGRDSSEVENLDSRFRRVASHHHAHFFRRGRVFKMLWTEPAGRDAPGNTRGSTHFSLVRFNETAYSEIRRFVVLQNKGTFSQCIPVQTYRGQGATKRGLVVEDHAIIYTADPGIGAPTPFEGEDITKHPIRVQSSSGEQLESASRVNFGKPYAVEHNCKVMDVGIVGDEHIHLLVGYFRQAMDVPL